MNIALINFHLMQAQHYNLALADPNLADYDTMRLVRRHASYHLAMADWLSSEPEQPPVTLIIRQHFMGAIINGKETPTPEQDDSEGSGETEDTEGHRSDGGEDGS